jgi:hypothetical protein
MSPPDPAILTPAMTTTSPIGFTTSLRPHARFTSLPDRYRSDLAQPVMTTGNHVADVMVEVGDGAGSTGKGIVIGILSAFGSAGVAIVILAVFFFLKYTRRGRILLDRIGRPGEFDDEQAFAREEAEALETMDDLSRTEYLRAKGKFPTISGLLPSHIEAH